MRFDTPCRPSWSAPELTNVENRIVPIIGCCSFLWAPELRGDGEKISRRHHAKPQTNKEKVHYI